MKRTVLGIGLGLVLATAGVRTAHAYEESAKPSESEVGKPLGSESEHRAGEGEKEGEKKDLSTVIFNHVSDERELEFQNPVTGDAKVIDLRPENPDKFKVNVAGQVLDFAPTKHLIWLWIASLVVILIFAIWRPRSITPRGFAVLLEMLVLFVRDEIAKPTIGDPEYKRYTPYLLSCFFFILVANLLGILPYTATATGNVAVTAGLAITTFLVTQAASIRSAGIGGYFAHLTGGVHWLLWPIMIPVEVLGLFTKPFALCMRLFANMVAGHIVIFYLLGLIFILKTVAVAPVSVALAAAIYMLELFVALLQAYVFTMLSSLFIGMGVAMGHHGHENHHHAEHDPKLAP